MDPFATPVRPATVAQQQTCDTDLQLSQKSEEWTSNGGRTGEMNTCKM